VQIITQRNFNSVIPPPHRQKDFLFCPDGCELSRRLEKARADLVMNDTPRRSASFARSLAKILRRRHQHVAHCASCILQEVFNGRLPQ